jgi:hypothetical protein
MRPNFEFDANGLSEGGEFGQYFDYSRFFDYFYYGYKLFLGPR